jgi:hypothetical protein
MKMKKNLRRKVISMESNYIPQVLKALKSFLNKLATLNLTVHLRNRALLRQHRRRFKKVHRRGLPSFISGATQWLIRHIWTMFKERPPPRLVPLLKRFRRRRKEKYESLRLAMQYWRRSRELIMELDNLMR